MSFICLSSRIQEVFWNLLTGFGIYFGNSAGEKNMNIFMGIRRVLVESSECLIILELIHS